MSISTLSAPTPQAHADDGAWWRGAIIYHIYPLSFADSNNDGFGDLRGIIEHLDYICALGVDAIWLSPFYTSPMRDFGYDISDYCNVDPVFGALTDFDALVEAAHSRGLKIIIDQVYSHTADKHAWFQESRRDKNNPKADWYVWADAKPDGAPPNNWQSVFKGPCWTWDARRQQYYLNNFQSDQPDLNVHNPEVQAALLSVAEFWLKRGVDGFRLDAINFAMHDPSLRDNPPVLDTAAKRTRPFDYQHHFFNQSHPDIPNFLTRVRALCESYGGAFLVAEVGGEQASTEMRLYTQGDDRLHSAYGFQYLYADTLSPDLVRAASENWPDISCEGWPAWAFSNHDAPRVASRWAHGRDSQALARMTMLLLVSLRGSIFVYQGEELGLPQAIITQDQLRDPEAIANWPLTLGRDGARTPIPWRGAATNAGFSETAPWLPVPPQHYLLAADTQEADAHSTLHAARSSLALRRRFPALRTGAIAFQAARGDILSFTRSVHGEMLLCVFNLDAERVDWALPEGWEIVYAVNTDEASGLPGFAGLVARAR